MATATAGHILAASLASSAVSTIGSARQASAQSKVQQQQLAQTRQTQAVQFEQKKRALEEQRKKTLARARAQLSASGANPSSGSSGAVLSNLGQTFDNQLLDNTKLFNLQQQGLATNLLKPNNALNLLQFGLNAAQKIGGYYSQQKG